MDRKTNELTTGLGSEIQSLNIEDYAYLDPEQFLDFLKMVPVETLLKNRRVQAAISKTMSFHFERDRATIDRVHEINPDIILLETPYPVIDVVYKGGISFHHGTFQLKEGGHWYYFSAGRPVKDIPEYLRPEDVIPSGLYTQTYPKNVRVTIKKDLNINDDQLDYLVYCQDARVTKRAKLVEIPFNKPIKRVPKGGGRAERYNYNTHKWEDSNEGIYNPGFKKKLLELAKGTVKEVSRKLPKKTRPKSLPHPKKE